MSLGLVGLVVVLEAGNSHGEKILASIVGMCVDGFTISVENFRGIRANVIEQSLSST